MRFRLAGASSGASEVLIAQKQPDLSYFFGVVAGLSIRQFAPFSHLGNRLEYPCDAFLSDDARIIVAFLNRGRRKWFDGGFEFSETHSLVHGF